MAGELSGSFVLTDSSGDAVTGEENADFTCTLWRDGGSTSDAVTVTEKGYGAYWFAGDATSVDKYHLHVKSDSGHRVNGSAAGATFDVYADAVVSLRALPVHTIGNGTFAVSIDVDDGEGAPVPGVCVRATDATGAVTYFTGTTDQADGRLAFNAEAGAYRFYPSKPGYLFDSQYVERTVSDHGALDPIECEQASLSAPEDPGLCRVFHFVNDAGQPAQSLSGIARAHALPQGIADGYTGMTSAEASLVRAAPGLFFLDLYRGARYEIVISAEGVDDRNGVVAVPDAGTAYLVVGEDGRLAITTQEP